MPIPETYLTNKQGHVIQDDHAYGYMLWRTGTPCRYRCRCACHQIRQLTLF